MEIYIKENSPFARFAAFYLKEKSMAFTLGKTIHLWHTRCEAFLNNEKWVRHEIMHVQQFQQHGFLFFIGKYLWEILLHGYANNKFEVAARLRENEAIDLNKFNFICHKK